jgi:hypothetical protein
MNKEEMDETAKWLWIVIVCAAVVSLIAWLL